MKKILDWLLKSFMWLYEIFLYFLIFPISLGIIIVLLIPLINSLANYLLDHIYLYICISIIMGLFLKKWRNKSITKNYNN